MTQAAKQMDIEECIDLTTWLNAQRNERAYWNYSRNSRYQSPKQYSGFSMRDIAEKTGISKGRIEKIFKDASQIRVSEFLALMDVFAIEDDDEILRIARLSHVSPG